MLRERRIGTCKPYTYLAVTPLAAHHRDQCLLRTFTKSVFTNCEANNSSLGWGSDFLDDDARIVGIAQNCASGISQPDGKRLIPFLHIVRLDDYVETLFGFARREI